MDYLHFQSLDIETETSRSTFRQLLAIRYFIFRITATFFVLLATSKITIYFARKISKHKQVLTRRRYWRRRHPRGGGNTAGASCEDDVEAIGAIKVKALDSEAPPTWQAPLHTGGNEGTVVLLDELPSAPPRVQRRLCGQRLPRRRRFCVHRLHPDGTSGLHVILTGGACRVPASTWMAPSPIAPPSQHLKKRRCHRVAM
ncbi:hypothetical protein PIB30_059254 [Stylosanthes scabra]|uniref:Uncharacterized protein n=1 Tax=Stylosanthes scabra TaxID=79078 RepID=A0ABU6WKW7_9FABA|nr:hypothetical protein [Stylosanthes scabra]